MSVSPRTAPLLVNKPTPPTPVSATRTNHQELFRDRSESATITVGPRTSRWRADPTPSPRLASVSERSSISDDMTEDEVLLGRPTRTTGDKIRQITGDENAQKYVDAKAAQVNVGGPAWYLRAQYADDELSTDTDGLVRTGTLRALVERLTLDVTSEVTLPFPSVAKIADATAFNTDLGQDKSFSRVFFLTFRTFASADDVFSMLTARYEAAPPEGLSPQELEDWRERKLRPTQSRVLSCLTAWLEDHGMLHEDPHIARRMQEFLSLISQPPALALTAQLIMQSLERMVILLWMLLGSV
jgi:son of sevenless-like protein